MDFAKIFIVAAASAAAFSAQAAGVGVRAGTTGIGADVGVNVAPTLDARVGYSYFSYKGHYNSSDVDYSAKLKLSNLNALLDWSPFPGGFRFSGGLIANQNKVDLNSTGTYRINGVAYNSSDASVSGTVKSGRSLAPYFGIGYGNVARAGVNFYFDLGIMFMGSPKASLSASCGSAVSAAQCAQLRNDLNNEQARIEDDLKKYKYYPVANIGLTIGF